MDFTRAVQCLAARAEHKTKEDSMVGIVKTRFRGAGPAYEVGDVVLFYRYPIINNVGRITQHNLSVERPLPLDEIIRNQKKGSLITTMATIVGVPDNYVAEVKGLDPIIGINVKLEAKP